MQKFSLTFKLILLCVFSYCQSQSVKSFQIFSDRGYRLPLATVISLSTGKPLELDSSASVEYSPSDSFRISHIGYRTVLVRPPIPEVLELESVELKLSEVDISAQLPQPIQIGFFPPRNRNGWKTYAWWGATIEQVVELRNTYSRPLKIEQAHYFLQNTALVEPLIQSFGIMYGRCYRAGPDSNGVPALIPLAGDYDALHKQELGQHEIIVNLSKMNLTLAPDECLYCGLYTPDKIGGDYSQHLRQDIVKLQERGKDPNILPWGTHIYNVRKRRAVVAYIRGYSTGYRWHRYTTTVVPTIFLSGKLL